jgi:hypothetical protein
MTSYGYTYPPDLSWMDEAFARKGRMRDLAMQVWRVSTYNGADPYEVVEDWPNIRGNWREVPGLQSDLMDINEEERLALHIGFGATEDEVLLMRAGDSRYTFTLRRNR